MNLFQFTERPVVHRGPAHRSSSASTIASTVCRPAGRSRRTASTSSTALTDFLQARPASVELTLPDSKLDRDWRQSMTAAYVQDDIRLPAAHREPGPALRAGQRAGGGERPVGELPRPFARRHADRRADVHQSRRTGTSHRASGVAWDPFGDGQDQRARAASASSSIRSGPTSTPTPATGWRRSTRWAASATRCSRAPTRWWAIPRSCWDAQDVLQYEPRNPYTMQYNLTVQRQLGADHRADGQLRRPARRAPGALRGRQPGDPADPGGRPQVLSRDLGAAQPQSHGRALQGDRRAVGLQRAAGVASSTASAAGCSCR